MQKQLLDAQPKAELSVNAIWLPVQPSDTLYIEFSLEEGKELLPDPRVTHHWDESQDIGRWFKQEVLPEFRGDVVWDSYLLYGPGAMWDRSPTPLVGTGFPVVRTMPDLLEQFRGLG